MLKKFLLFVFISFSSLIHAEGEWKHVHFQTAQGPAIQLDYQILSRPIRGCYACSQPVYATPLWIHVSHETFTQNDSVRVVLLSFRSSPGRKEILTDTREVDLSFTGNRTFSKEILPELLIHANVGPRGIDFFRQEIAVVVNGQWLKNVNDKNSSNMSFNLFN